MCATIGIAMVTATKAMLAPMLGLISIRLEGRMTSIAVAQKLKLKLNLMK